MKESYMTTPLNLGTFYSFCRLKVSDQCRLIEEKGVLLDVLKTNEHSIRIYFLDGFFIEQMIDENTVIENIPFRQGYRVSQYIGRDNSYNSRN